MNGWPVVEAMAGVALAGAVAWCALGRRPPARPTQIFKEVDDSFIEPAVERALKCVSSRMPTEHMIRFIDGRRRSAWGGEEVAYVAFLSIAAGALALTSIGLSTWSAALLLGYASWRITDIFTYELRVILVDPKDPLPWGHVLSVNRRALLGIVRVGEFILTYSLVYLALHELQGPGAFTTDIGSPVAAFYQSVVTATLAGMTASLPDSDWARFAAALEMLLALLLFALVLAVFVQSLRPLTEIDPRPVRRGQPRPWEPPPAQDVTDGE